MEAKQELNVREIINDLNYYDMLKNFCKLFVSMGYSGFMINLDEAINLYKISTSVMREKNYEKILTIYNDCFQGKVANLFFNFAGTKEVLENERRGLFSYNALKSRLLTNKFETAEIRDFAQPVIRLMPLDHNEIFVLLKKLKAIFDYNYKTDISISDNEKSTTNNRMELQAIIESIKFIQDKNKEHKIFSDSQLTINCATRKWKRNKNLDLWEIFDNEIKNKNVIFL